LEPRKIVRMIGKEEGNIPLNEKGFVREVADTKLVIDPRRVSVVVHRLLMIVYCISLVLLHLSSTEKRE
jgi:hypothetical protein